MGMLGDGSTGESAHAAAALRNLSLTGDCVAAISNAKGAIQTLCALLKGGAHPVMKEHAAACLKNMMVINRHSVAAVRKAGGNDALRAAIRNSQAGERARDIMMGALELVGKP